MSGTTYSVLLLVLLLLNVNKIYIMCVCVCGFRRTTRKTIIKYEKKDPWLPMYEYIKQQGKEIK